MIAPKLKKTVKKINIKFIIVIYILVFSISPFVQQATSRYLTTYFYMVIVVVTVIFTFVTCSIKNIREYILLLIPFILFQSLDILTTPNSNILLRGYQIVLFMLPVCLGYYIIKKYEKDGVGSNRVFTAVIILTYLITLVTTIVGCINNPNAARVLATTASSDDPTAVSYNWQNIGGYTFVYSCTLLYPLLVLSFKRRKLSLILVIAFAAAEFMLAINTEYTISLMLILFSSLLFFLPSNLTSKKFIIISVVTVVLVVVFSSIIAVIMQRIGEMIGNEMMAEKMTAVFSGKEAMDSMEDRRVDRYMLSLETFIKNPLFGSMFSGDMVKGGHSFILDTLSQYGLVGGVLLGFMYWRIFRIFYKPFKDKLGFGFVIWLFIQPIVLSTLNTDMWLNNLCLFSPIMLISIFGVDDPIDKENNKRKSILLRLPFS